LTMKRIVLWAIVKIYDFKND